MKTCPYCRKRIDPSAVRCPHCAADFDGSQMEAGRREHSRERRGTLWLALLAVAAFLWWFTRSETIDGFAEQAARDKIESEQGSN